MLVAYARRCRGLLDQGGELLEDAGGGEAIWLQDQLALQVLDIVVPAAVSVVAGLMFGEPLGDLPVVLM